MKRFGLLLVIVGSLLSLNPARATSQIMMGGKGWQDTMCKRMCDQYGKKNQVCGTKNNQTYDNACVAKCDKISYKRGACPKKDEKPEEGVPMVSLSEEETLAQIEAEDKRPGGVVKFFDWDKGSGAVVADDGQELYVDASAVTGDAVETLKEGDRVKFDITQGPKGMHAAKVSFELSDQEKHDKIAKAGELQMVEEQKPEKVAPQKQMMHEAVSKDGVYVLPSR